ncbi:glycoside hydrolase family 88 protein [Reichenbachiella ulvae]|uniref:Glycoside hydrolase family 88 protein n=1 Tax=Reichenbachiella ulvae TaxID=2980104 RepID=A0ABT3CUI8_9BACT|nr:glycoside hydrolase family 88 protein [Reichenbachiella ulvae]MCV9387302.1 glycoside hydrolase family 88 protein [Reichenbachiella ulvae]
MSRLNLLVIGCLFFFFSCEEKSSSEESKKEQQHTDIKSTLTGRFDYLLQYEVDSVGFPRCLEEDKSVRGVPSKDWTSGFFPGSLMYIYQLTGDQKYLDRALEWLPYMEKEKWNDYTHDMGFKVYCSFGNAYEITKEESYKEVIIQSAKTLMTRYSPTVGCIKSWEFGKEKWDFPVIIDNMMNLELLFEATQLSGDSSFYQAAVSHAEKTMVNHYRPDHSSYHVVDYNPETGEVQNKLTHQGLNVESLWSRGQGWGLYGYTMVYRYTGDEKFLNHAKKIADFVIELSNQTDDNILYWDMSDPNIPDAPKDASASAVVASALLELAAQTNEQSYSDYANSLIEVLKSDAYVLPSGLVVPFVLGHSTGNYPKDDEIDVPIAYGDYYFLEAMYRAKTNQYE